MTEVVAATRSLVVERVMPHPPEKIWRALTQAPLIEAWLMKNDFQPIVGPQVQFPRHADPRLEWSHGLRGAGNHSVPTPCVQLERFRRSGRRWPEDHRDVDADTRGERNAGPDGAIRIPAAG